MLDHIKLFAIANSLNKTNLEREKNGRNGKGTKWKRHTELNWMENHHASVATNFVIRCEYVRGKEQKLKSHSIVCLQPNYGDAVLYLPRLKISFGHGWKCPINYFVISAFLPSGVSLTAMKIAHTRPDHHMKRDILSASRSILSFSHLRSFWRVCVCVIVFGVGTSPNRHLQN